MSGVVLMYHRIAAVRNDPYGLAVHPERFAEHAEHLGRLGCVVPLEEVMGTGRTPTVAITFDDGYADNATTAAPVLEQAGLPATYFITTGRLGGRAFWWDELATALLADRPMSEGIDVRVAGRPLWLALNDSRARETSLRFLHRRLRPLPPDEVVAVVEEVAQRLDAPAPPVDERSMTDEQVSGLARLQHAQIGAHTRTHLQLAGQSEALQRSEILGSVQDLSQLLGRPVTTFAYPFGTARAVGDLAPRLSQEAGCAVACTTERRAVSGRVDAHRLPRLNVRDWSGAELAARLAELLPASSRGRWRLRSRRGADA